MACSYDKNASCNFHLWDHKNAADADLLNGTEIQEWAQSFAAGFHAAGYKPGEVSMVALALDVKVILIPPCIFHH